MSELAINQYITNVFGYIYGLLSHCPVYFAYFCVTKNRFPYRKTFPGRRLKLTL